jgi:copper chaperone
MNLTIDVENIKCGGCAGSIKKGLTEDPRVQSVEVDVAEGRVSVETGEDIRDELVARLSKLGYPEKGSVEGIKSLKAKAKSFVSCAVGRMGEDK